MPRLSDVSPTQTTRRPNRGDRGARLLGHFARARQDCLGLFMRAWQQQGDIVRFRFGPLRAFLLAHPAHIQHVLQSNHRNYDKHVRGYKVLKLLVGNGILTSEGDFWLRQRRAAQPAFAHQRLLAAAGFISHAAEEMVTQWRDHAKTGQSIDLHEEMMRVTLQILGRTMLGVDLSRQADTVSQASDIAQDEIMRRHYSLLPLPLLWLSTRRYRRVRRAVAALDQIVFSIIRERHEQGGSQHGDLLSTLMAFKEEQTGQIMSDRQLRDEVMSILLAGHETIANALTWTWYLLSTHPDVEHRLRQELRHALDGRTPTAADLERLPYCNMVFQESMRLYPPAWILQRRTIKADELSGVRLRAGSLVMLSPFVTHRHPAFWEQPQAFYPEHFRPEVVSARARFAYFPFGGGPHRCIGEGLAMLEGPIVLAALAQHYHLALVPGHVVTPHPSITLRCRHGLPMTVHEMP